MGSTVFPPAASGPTLSEITSAGTSAGWGNVGDSSWTLVSSAVLNYSANNVTFSGLSGYKTYRLTTGGTNISGNGGSIYVRLNGAASNYDYFGAQNYGSTLGMASSAGAGGHYINEVASNNWFWAECLIEHCNLSSAKTFTSKSVGGGYHTALSGRWNSSATVSSITLLNLGTGTFGSNTIYLYGAN